MKTHDLVAVTGSYTNQNGETKNRYQNVGFVNKSDKGISIKLSCIPFDEEGKLVTWLQAYPVKDKQQTHQSAPSANLDDSIPF